MPKVICVKCERDFRPKDIGVLFLDMAYDPPMPMQSHSADIWECPGCKQEIVVGMSTGNHDQNYIMRETESAAVNDRRIVRSFENEKMKNKFYETEQYV